jgi:hypothetical protein
MTDARAPRAALLALHRELLEAQRVQAERFGGRMSAGEVLQAAADDLRFDWLRVISQLIAELDEGLATQERDQVDSVIARTRGLLGPPMRRACSAPATPRRCRTTRLSSSRTATWSRLSINRE